MNTLWDMVLYAVYYVICEELAPFLYGCVGVPIVI